MASPSEIRPHPLTGDPTLAWQIMKKTQIVHRVKPLPLDTPIDPHQVRFVCISDTHSLISRMEVKVPDGDILIHAGDFTRNGSYKEVQRFNEFLGSLPHKYKVIIAGNHELSFDPRTTRYLDPQPHDMVLDESVGQDEALCSAYEMFTVVDEPPRQSKKCPAKKLITNAVYLEDSEVTIYGLRLYGTPWQPEYLSWAFNLRRGHQCLEKWNLIPEGVDVLLTHTPPLGHGDLCSSGVRAGCAELLATIQQRVHPKFNVFGHIHEGYGITTDNQTIFINCSTCNVNYRPVNPPVIFDIPLPPTQKKS